VLTEQDERELNSLREHAFRGQANEDLHTIRNIDIFASGVWRGANAPPAGTHYSISDLHSMVAAYAAGVIVPKIKITHGDDGLIDVGEARNLRVEGKKLLCDFVDVPRGLYELLRKGLFHDRSAEILHGVRDHLGRRWKRVVRAVALLAPGQVPAVSTLSPGYKFERAYAYQYHFGINEKGGTTMRKGVHPITDGILYEQQQTADWLERRRAMADANAELHSRAQKLHLQLKASHPQAKYEDALNAVRLQDPALHCRATTGR